MSREPRHTLSATGGTKTSFFTRKCYEFFLAAVRTSKPRKASMQISARQVTSQLAFDKFRKAPTVFALLRLGQEGFEIFADNPME